MRPSRLTSLAFVLTVALAVTFARAADKAPAPSADRDDYPLKTCVVSNETLTGDFITYTHREPGKPDRIVRLCCEGCIEDFRIDPPKYLKKLEEAKSTAAKPSPAPKKK